MCLFHHDYIKVEDVDHKLCGNCYTQVEELDTIQAAKYPKGYCPHSFKVCIKCGKYIGYGSHGKLSVVPSGCQKQIKFMGGKFE